MRMHRLLSLLCLFAVPLASAENIATERLRRVVIDQAITPAFVEEVRALKGWPHNYQVRIGKNASQDALDSLPQLSELRQLLFEERISEINSLEPISQLPDLGYLYIIQVQMPEGQKLSLEPLAKCQKLTKLWIKQTPVTGESALSNCQFLTEVTLEDGGMRSLDWLQGTSNIVKLRIMDYEEPLDSFSCISALEGLRHLELKNYPSLSLQDLAVVSGMERLNFLRIKYCGEAITNLDFVKSCANMDDLYIESSGEISDISGVGYLPLLRNLVIHNANGLTNLSPLSACPRLERIWIHRGDFADLSPLRHLPVLRELWIYRNSELSDLGPLANSVTLETLNIHNTSVCDITPLEKLINMQNLTLDDSPVRDLAPIAQMKALGTLVLTGTEVTSLVPLERLHGLNNLYLNDSIPQAEIDRLKPFLPLTFFSR